MSNIQKYNFNEIDQKVYDLLVEARDKLLAETSLYEFFKQAWEYIDPEPYIDNWHIKTICDHLEACYRGDIRNLLINIPPRTSKTMIISIAFPIWVWIQDPRTTFLCSSIGHSLTKYNSSKSRDLVKSSWFQKNWGDKIFIPRSEDTKMFFRNNHGGYRLAISVGSATVGRGALFRICDDPNDLSVYSKTITERTRNWFIEKWASRSNNPNKGANIVVQQRTYRDLSGLIIDNDVNDEWVKLRLPMEYDSNIPSKTYIKGKLIWEDPRTKNGELLTPYRAEALKKLKAEMSTSSWKAQFQQAPEDDLLGIIKREWFKPFVGRLPKFEIIIQSWDTAISDAPTAAYSACTTWGVWRNPETNMCYVLLLSLWRDRVNFPDLRKRAKRLFHNYLDIQEEEPSTILAPRVDVVLIENKATGDPLIAELRKIGIAAVPYNPTRQGDKEGRVQRIAHFIEAGLVYLPTKFKQPDTYTNMSNELLSELCSFPNSENRDIVDTVSQVLSYLRDRQFLNINPDEQKQFSRFNTGIS